MVVVAGAHGRSPERHADEIGDGPIPARPGEAEWRDRAPDEPGRIRGERFVAEAEGIERARFRAIDDNIGAGHEGAPARGVLRSGEREGDAALVRVEVGEAQAGVGVGAVVDEGAGVAGAGALGGFDADHLHPRIGEELAGDLATVADLHGSEAGEGTGHQTAPSETSVSNSASL